MRGDSTRGNKWKMWITNFSRETLFSRKVNSKRYAARASDQTATKRFDRKIMFQRFSPNHAGTTYADCLFIRSRYLTGSGISITSRKLIR